MARMGRASAGDVGLGLEAAEPGERGERGDPGEPGAAAMEPAGAPRADEPRPASPMAPPAAPGDRTGLEEERDFCLRSLRDLEAERLAGDIDEADYQGLKDSYTLRAAAAIHALEGSAPTAAPDRASDGDPEGSPSSDDDDVPSEPARHPPEGARRRRRGRGVLLAVGVVAVAASAAWAVAASSATRLPGEEISGQALAPQEVANSLQQAQQAADRGDDLTAVKDYQKILSSDPNQAEALAGEGWVLAQTQQPALLQQGLTMLQDSERSDPTYAPAHVYRGISLLSEGDYTGAIPEFQWYLAHNPDPQLAPRVRVALQQAEAQVAATAKTPKG